MSEAVTRNIVIEVTAVNVVREIGTENETETLGLNTVAVNSLCFLLYYILGKCYSDSKQHSVITSITCSDVLHCRCVVC